MNRLSNPVLFKLFLVILAIDAVLFSILAGIVLNALVNAIGFTPELVTWIAIYVSAMVIFTIILFVLVIVTVTIRVKGCPALLSGATTPGNGIERTQFCQNFW